ncbi:YT521-B-like domain-containing protein, partial [Mycena olivaceomarginata]
RRPYHPAPPAHRSDWVMWAGNVPSDTKHDELWHFFMQGPQEGVGGRWVAGNTSATLAPGADITHAFTNTSAPTHGILSIFLISRSSCAFINYASSLALSAAIERFHDAPLRTGDTSNRLVCKVRCGSDDLHTGVGEQCGTGMHVHWVKEREHEWEDAESASHSSPASASHSNSMSTNSSVLARHFPQWFFILKSLTKEDVDLSVQTGVWATQHHNEGVLNRAFRTAVDVFLIFSVNKSGEFYGWARCVCSYVEFALHWRSTTPLPFMCTRHLQNPWNHGRAVKMSRDGTELEPAVGHALIKV